MRERKLSGIPEHLLGALSASRHHGKGPSVLQLGPPPGDSSGLVSTSGHSVVSLRSSVLYCAVQSPGCVHVLRTEGKYMS